MMALCTAHAPTDALITKQARNTELSLMSRVSRRTILKSSCALALASASLPWNQISRALPSGPSLKFPIKPRERLAVASWPFRAYIDAPRNRRARDTNLPGMDLKHFAAWVVQRFGLRRIEPLDQHFGSTDTAYIQELRQAIEKAGASVVNIPVGLQASFYDPNPAGRKEAIEAGRKWIDIAALLGSPSVRLHISGVNKLKPDVERTAASLKQVAEYGAEKNVLVNLENDDNLTEDPFFIVSVIEKVDNAYLRALPDFCNSMLTHDQAFNHRALMSLFKHAYNIAHVKDSEVGDQGRLFIVDVAACFKIAKAAGYRGYFSMEWEGRGDPLSGTQRLIDLSLKSLARYDDF
jgi:sugar phosphate isomerase/epimerase